MKEKLRILMQKENLTASRLAEILGIKPAGISHILSGRNNPGYELICKIVNAFPQVNPYWLLGDSEKMYNDSVSEPATSKSSAGLLFDFGEESGQVNVSGTKSPTAVPENNRTAIPVPDRMTKSEISRIIILYRDRTFESFSPFEI